MDAMLDPKIEELDHQLATIAKKESVSDSSSSAALCPTGKCDVFVQPGVPFQWDYGHCTPEGSVGIVGRFRDRLRDALANGSGRQIAAGRIGN